jgi:hypothetical protein
MSVGWWWRKAICEREGGGGGRRRPPPGKVEGPAHGPTRARFSQGETFGWRCVYLKYYKSADPLPSKR